MKTKALFFFGLVILLGFSSKAQESYFKANKNDTLKIAAINLNGEILPWVVVNEVIVSAKRIFKSPEDFAKYRRLKYNVLKVLPYARFAGQRYRQLERDLAVTTEKRKQKALVKGCEKEIKDLFNRDVKNMTISQGEVLIKLIDRETGNSSFDLVKDMKGGVSAFVMQSVAKVFGHDLKKKYDPDEERDIEAIIRAAGYYSYQ